MRRRRRQPKRVVSVSEEAGSSPARKPKSYLHRTLCRSLGLGAVGDCVTSGRCRFWEVGGSRRVLLEWLDSPVSGRRPGRESGGCAGEPVSR